jgi:putative phosphoribosyl transferase
LGLFRKARAEAPPIVVPDRPGTIRRTVLLSLDPVQLPGQLLVPAEAAGYVIIAGLGSGPTGAWSVELAEALDLAGLGSLRCDLLTPEEVAEVDDEQQVDLFARRLLAAIRWLATRPDVGALPVGLLGTGHGAAGALVAAGRLRSEIAAVVSFDGNPELAGSALDRISAPTLLLVGDGASDRVALHRAAESHLGADGRLELVPGVVGSLEDPRSRSQAERLAIAWLQVHLVEASRARSHAIAGYLP